MPKHIAIIAVCNPIFHPYSFLSVRSGPVWRQDLAIATALANFGVGVCVLRTRV